MAYPRVHTLLILFSLITYLHEIKLKNRVRVSWKDQSTEVNNKISRSVFITALQAD